MKCKGYMHFTYFAKENEKYELWDILIRSANSFLFFAVLQFPSAIKLKPMVSVEVIRFEKCIFILNTFPFHTRPISSKLRE